MDAVKQRLVAWQADGNHHHSPGSEDDDDLEKGQMFGNSPPSEVHDGGHDPLEHEENEVKDETVVTEADLGVEGAQTWLRLIYADIAVVSVSMVVFKWLMAVMLRKIFLWLEARFLGGPSLFGLETSDFWKALFLDQVDFFTILGISFVDAVVFAVAGTLVRALPIRLAGAVARARRAHIVRAALNSMVLADKDYQPTYLLEQISMLSEYESHVKFQRAGARFRLMVAIVACFVLFWQGTMVTIAIFFGILVIQFALTHRLIRRPTAARSELLGSVHGFIADVLRGGDVVAMHNMEDHELQELAAKEAQGARLDRDLSSTVILVGVPELMLIIILMPCVLLLARLMFETSASVLDAVNMLFALTAMFFIFDDGHKALILIINSNDQANKYAQALRVVNDALRAAPPYTSDQDGDEGGLMHQISPGRISFEHVTVKYPNTVAPAVRDISFTIPQGQTMAVVAESGGGKSTLFRVASSLLTHQAGDVIFGTVKLNELTKHAIRARMGFVSQDSMLFARSIRENIWYGNESEPNDDFIWMVLEQIGLDAWARSLDDGLATVLASERMVSGGQAQRLQIARLLCRKGLYFVLLDECMSALDPVMRSVVTQALKAFLHGKTTMIITHSHDTVTDLCDQVADLGKLQRKEDRAVLPAREYLAGLRHEKKAPRSFWKSFFADE